MTASPHNAHYRPDIDGMRAIAVVAVVLHHAFPHWLPSGFIGVDVFFVLSGYLISSIILSGLQKGKFSFTDFYARRIKRIFPALLLVMAATWAMGWYQLIPVDLKALGKHLLAGSVFMSNFAFWREAGYFDAASASKPLLHLWSLAIEEQFYLFWPLALFALNKWRWNVLRWVVVVLLISFVLNMVLVQDDPTAAFYNPASRFWELMVGTVLATLHIQRVGRRQLLRRSASTGESSTPTAPRSALKSNALSWLGVLLLAVAFVRLSPERTFPGTWALLPTLGTVLLIAAGPEAWFNRTLLASKPFVWIGLISYPLYLWHWPFLAYAHLEAGALPDWKTQTLWIGVAVLLAWLTYVLVEKPIRFGRFNRQATTFALGVFMSGMATAGLITHQKDGFDSRFPVVVRDMISKGGLRAHLEGWRVNQCMLDYKHPASDYKDFCIDKKRPLVFLWGDSHAGSLYPGFKALQDKGVYKFGIGERTSATCPPVLGVETRPLCKSLNDAGIQAIRESKPDVVILYAWWHRDRYDLRNLEATVEEIKKAGVPRIIMLGSVPYWQQDLPKILLAAWKKGPVTARPPLRLKVGQGLDPKLQAATTAMRARAQAMGIEFIAGTDFFCNVDGCLTRLTNDATQPLSYDYGHLSLGAVTYYVEQLAPKIFKAP